MPQMQHGALSLHSLLALIDSCTKLMRDDRIWLRNKIKDGQEGEDQQLWKLIGQVQRKVGINRASKDQKIMAWLQVKLRKYITQCKKEKTKKQIETFKNIQHLKIYPTPSLNQSILHSKDNHRDNYRDFRGQVHDAHPKESSQKAHLQSMSLSATKLNKGSNLNYSYTVSPKGVNKRKKLDVEREKTTHTKYRKTAWNRQNQGKTLFSSKSHEKYKGNSKGKDQPTQNHSNIFQNSNNKLQSTQKQNITKTNLPINKLQASFQKKPISSPNKIQEKSSNYQQNIKKYLPQKQQQFQPPLPPCSMPLNDSSLSNPSFSLLENMHSRGSLGFDWDKVELSGIVEESDVLGRYEKSAKKVKELLEESQNITKDFADKYSQSYEKSKIQNYSQRQSYQKNKTGLSFTNTILPQVSVFNDDKSSSDLFTPPQLLEECRKFTGGRSGSTSFSYGLPTYFPPYISSLPLSFRASINADNVPSSAVSPHLTQFPYHQTVSESDISSRKPNSPNSQVLFRHRCGSINRAEDLLAALFKGEPEIAPSAGEMEDILSRMSTPSPLQTELVNYFQSEASSNTILFIKLAKYLHSQVPQLFAPQLASHTLLLILDIDKKGFIASEDISMFIESLEGAQISVSIIRQIHGLLLRIFKRAIEIETLQNVDSNQISEWSLYYFQIQHDSQFQSLCDKLQQFEFHFDENDQQTQ